MKMKDENEKKTEGAEPEEVTEKTAEESSEAAVPETETDGAGSAAETAETDKEQDRPVKPKEQEKRRIKKLEAKIAELEKKLEESEAGSAAKDDKYLLLYAEYDNYRKRSQKEKESIWTDAYSDAINNLLPVLDNLERAVAYTDAEGLAEGLKMTVKSFGDTLAKMGVTEIPALGEKFDPSLHYAVFHVDDDSYGENEIIEVLGKGYMREGRVIRYAMVKVAN